MNKKWQSVKEILRNVNESIKSHEENMIEKNKIDNTTIRNVEENMKLFNKVNGTTVKTDGMIKQNPKKKIYRRR